MHPASPTDRRAFDVFNDGVMLAATGDRDAAIVAYQAVIATGDCELAARAAFNIAALRCEDLQAARTAYLAAIEAGHPDVAPKAAFNLGSLLAADGDLAGARVMLEQAVGFGHEDVSARAAVMLQMLAAVLSLDSTGSDRGGAARGAGAPRVTSGRPPEHRRRARSHRNAFRDKRLRGCH